MLQDKGPGEENPGEIRGPQVAPAINQSSQTLISFSPFIFFQLTSLPKHYHRLSPSSLQSISLPKHYRISPSSFRSISLPKHYNLFPTQLSRPSIWSSNCHLLYTILFYLHSSRRPMIRSNTALQSRAHKRPRNNSIRQKNERSPSRRHMII